jgi:hypothetical protein
MPIEGFSADRVSSNPLITPVYDWGSRLVAPVGAPFMSKAGMIEIAGRVYLIVVALVITAVIVAFKYGYLTGRTTPPDLPSNEIGKLRQQQEQLQLQIAQMGAQQRQLKMRVKEQPGQQLLEQRLELLERLVPLLEQNIQLEEQIVQLEQGIKEQEH